MFGSTILDPAIGIIFVFMLVSLLVSAINEMLSAALRSRAKWLRKGIESLLDPEWAKRLYDHPLIVGYSGDPSWMARWLGSGASGPSYIPSRTFAGIVMDFLQASDTATSKVCNAMQEALDTFPARSGNVASLKQSVVAALAKAGDAAASHTAAFGLLLDRIPDESAVSTGDSVDAAKRDIQGLVRALSERHLREAIAMVPSASLQKTLTVLLDDAQRKSEDFTQNLEIWFNNGMDRVGGWYKRRAQWVVLGVAALVTVVVNVDTLSILHQLSTQSGMRDALVAQARAFAEKPPVMVLSATQAAAPAPEIDDLEAKFKTVHAQLEKLNLPIGWYRASASTDNGGLVPQQTIEFRKASFLMLPTADTLGATILFHLVGWLLTIIAASLGAPFWFDMLNKVVAIRSAGKAPEETPKPPKEGPTPLGPGQSQQVADILAAARQR